MLVAPDCDLRDLARLVEERLLGCIDGLRLNVNLLEHIRFPPRKATYQVYATLEEHKSNVLTLDVTPE